MYALPTQSLRVRAHAVFGAALQEHALPNGTALLPASLPPSVYSKTCASSSMWRRSWMEPVLVCAVIVAIGEPGGTPSSSSDGTGEKRPCGCCGSGSAQAFSFYTVPCHLVDSRFRFFTGMPRLMYKHLEPSLSRCT